MDVKKIANNQTNNDSYEKATNDANTNYVAPTPPPPPPPPIEAPPAFPQGMILMLESFHPTQFLILLSN